MVINGIKKFVENTDVKKLGAIVGATALVAGAVIIYITHRNEADEVAEVVAEAIDVEEATDVAEDVVEAVADVIE